MESSRGIVSYLGKQISKEVDEELRNLTLEEVKEQLNIDIYGFSKSVGKINMEKKAKIGELMNFLAEGPKLDIEIFREAYKQ